MGILVFGTVWFWLLALAAISLIIWFLEDSIDYERTYKDNGGGNKISLIILVSIVLYYFFGSKEHIHQIFNYVTQNPGKFIFMFLGYVCVGIVWSIIRWYFFLRNFKSYYVENNYKITLENIPKVSNNKYKIITWMSYWPFSLFWFLFDEPLRKTFKYIFESIEGVYDKISKKVFSKVYGEEN